MKKAKNVLEHLLWLRTPKNAGKNFCVKKVEAKLYSLVPREPTGAGLYVFYIVYIEILCCMITYKSQRLQQYLLQLYLEVQ